MEGGYQATIGCDWAITGEKEGGSLFLQGFGSAEKRVGFLCFQPRARTREEEMEALLRLLISLRPLYLVLLRPLPHCRLLVNVVAAVSITAAVANVVEQLLLQLHNRLGSAKHKSGRARLP